MSITLSKDHENLLQGPETGSATILTAKSLASLLVEELDPEPGQLAFQVVFDLDEEGRISELALYEEEPADFEEEDEEEED